MKTQNQPYQANQGSNIKKSKESSEDLLSNIRKYRQQFKVKMSSNLGLRYDTEDQTNINFVNKEELRDYINLNTEKYETMATSPNHQKQRVPQQQAKEILPYNQYKEVMIKRSLQAIENENLAASPIRDKSSEKEIPHSHGHGVNGIRTKSREKLEIEKHKLENKLISAKNVSKKVYSSGVSNGSSAVSSQRTNKNLYDKGRVIRKDKLLTASHDENNYKSNKSVHSGPGAGAGTTTGYGAGKTTIGFSCRDNPFDFDDGQEYYEREKINIEKKNKEMMMKEMLRQHYEEEEKGNNEINKNNENIYNKDYSPEVKRKQSQISYSNHDNNKPYNTEKISTKKPKQNKELISRQQTYQDEIDRQLSLNNEKTRQQAHTNDIDRQSSHNNEIPRQQSYQNNNNNTTTDRKNPESNRNNQTEVKRQESHRTNPVSNHVTDPTNNPVSNPTNNVTNTINQANPINQLNPNNQMKRQESYTSDLLRRKDSNKVSNSTKKEESQRNNPSNTNNPSIPTNNPNIPNNNPNNSKNPTNFNNLLQKKEDTLRNKQNEIKEEEIANPNDTTDNYNDLDIQKQELEKLDEDHRNELNKDDFASKKGAKNNKYKNDNRYFQNIQSNKMAQIKEQIQKKYERFDVQDLSYKIVREYSHLKLKTDKNFLQRMEFDSYKRHEKPKKIEEMLNEQKVRMDEIARLKAFNRLIDDANRRFETQINQTIMPKEELSSIPSTILANIGKKYKKKEWEEIYVDRFKAFEERKNNKINKKLEEKFLKRLIEEEQIQENEKQMKGNNQFIKKVVDRLNGDAERRKVGIDKKAKVDRSHSYFNMLSPVAPSTRVEMNEIDINSFKKQKAIKEGKYVFSGVLTDDDEKDEEYIPYNNTDGNEIPIENKASRNLNVFDYLIENKSQSNKTKETNNVKEEKEEKEIKEIKEILENPLQVSQPIQPYQQFQRKEINQPYQQIQQNQQFQPYQSSELYQPNEVYLHQLNQPQQFDTESNIYPINLANQAKKNSKSINTSNKVNSNYNNYYDEDQLLYQRSIKSKNSFNSYGINSPKYQNKIIQHNSNSNCNLLQERERINTFHYDSDLKTEIRSANIEINDIKAIRPTSLVKHKNKKFFPGTLANKLVDDIMHDKF